MSHKLGKVEFPGGLVIQVVTAVAQVQSLVQELPHAVEHSQKK